jgi:hypothetical protein
MSKKKASATIQIRVDDINSLRCKTLLAYASALHYKYEIVEDKDVRRSARRRSVVGEPRIVTDEIDD